ncbi:zinc ribbon domain-containing protein [Deinococcus yunweiensis]|uniref:zinc ribbon domain-containing protein n=1 Tax=Deinococcus yunweiensis TaxID=367282 RepID=UPI00398EA902
MSTTVEFPQSLILTPAQETQLRHLWSLVAAAQRSVTLHLHLRAAGHEFPLVEVVDAALGGRGGSLPALPGPDDRVTRPVHHVDELLSEFRRIRDARGWSTLVPAEAFEAVIRETCAAFRTLPPHPRFGDLPATWPVSQPLRLSLGSSVHLIDPLSIEVAPLRDHARVLADAYLLPAPFWAALQRDQEVQLDRIAGRLKRLDAAWLDSGDVDAAAQALQLRARYAGRGLHRRTPHTLLDGNLPRKCTRVLIREAVRPGLPTRFEVVWTFDVQGLALKPPRSGDTIGIDPGERHVYAWATVTDGGVVPRPFHGLWRIQTPTLDGDPPTCRGPHDFAFARAHQRWQLFQRLQPVYEGMLERCFSYRTVALEDTDFAGLHAKGRPFAAYAETVGLTAALQWIVQLAPLHDVEIRLVPPEYSSRTCSRCWLRSRRPRPGEPFVCATCGHAEDSDVNAARVHRGRALQR